MIVFLIGFMGCGKAKGRKLASLLGFRYIDMDEYIETNQGQTITQLFERLGEEQFLKIEHEALLSLCKNQQTVIATGGGAPCYFDGIERMNLVGKTVYLKGNAEFLRERLLLSKSKAFIANLKYGRALPLLNKKLNVNLIITKQRLL
ncbi:MAG: shikimate kinase [Bacteroidetes bacterium]|nr:shikimate kinase [Bacteroidota bacterium]